MVYVDRCAWPWRGKYWGHLVADSVEELHNFARQIGLKRAWFQEPPDASFPHYDVTTVMRARALEAGAVGVTRRELGALIRRLREAV